MPAFTSARSLIIHQGRRVPPFPVTRTWCGKDINPDTWRELVKKVPDCPRCAAARDRFVQATAPFGPGERVHYSKRRHPGLASFFTARDGSGQTLWTVLACAENWSATGDFRAPPGRPVRLALGAIAHTGIGYFPTVTAAIQWTVDVSRTGRLPQLHALLDTGRWRPLQTPLTFMDSGQHKETNPA